MDAQATTTNDTEHLLRQAVDALRAARAKEREPIAIIGMACRFPGAPDLEAYWTLLDEGRSGVAKVSPDRWNPADYRGGRDTPGTIASNYAGLVDGIDRFDHEFFGITGREARSMDPQQRLVLEISWHALERAGLRADRLKGSKTGVFVGATARDYAALLQEVQDEEPIDAYYVSGNSLNFIAGRVSYTLGLNGPAMAVDTACSSSLSAVHLAVQSLRRGESSIALAGGVNLVLAPEVAEASSRSNLLSPEGACRSFDAAANGIVRGEGCGMVVLERLSSALENDRDILAVIRETGVNQDGASSGLMAPNGDAQFALIRDTLARARLTPDGIDYVEAHGTGTPLGDPIELGALQRIAALREDSSLPPLPIGSCKSNLGHLESAAGAAALIKVVLSLRHQRLPASIHFDRLNDAAGPSGDVEILSRARPWPRGAERVRRAGISAFGGSGSNAHCVVEEAPTRTAREAMRIAGARPITLSARDEQGLRRQAEAWLARPLETVPLADIAQAANAGRVPFRQRAVIFADDIPALRNGLEAIARGEQPLPAGVETERASARAPRIAFLFSGQGSQRPGMGRDLYDASPVFRDAIDRMAPLFRRETGVALCDLLWGDATDRLVDTQFTQPALFAFERAIEAVWRDWGITPGIVMGHSVGEIAAACSAGLLAEDQALSLIAARGRLMSQMCRPGAMLAIRLPAGELDLSGYAGRLSFAAFNGPASTVVAGQSEALDGLEAALRGRDVACQRLAVSHGFHSAMMEPMIDAFDAHLRGVDFAQPNVPIVSNVTGAIADAAMASPEYWTRHVLAPVDFTGGLDAIIEHGATLAIEVGPGTTLAGLVRGGGFDLATLASLEPRDRESDALRRAAGRAWVKGADIDWDAFDGPRLPGVTHILPGYAFAPTRAWPDARPARRRAKGADPVLAIGSQPLERHEERARGLAVIGDGELAAHVASSADDEPIEQTVIFADTLCSEVGDLASTLNALLDVNRRLIAGKIASPASLVLRDEEGGDRGTVSALAAMARCLMLEQPTIWDRIVEIEAGIDTEHAARSLMEALATPGSGERNLRIDADGIGATRLIHIDSGPDGDDPSAPPPGAHVISGGFGTLGLALAEHLVGQGVQHVVLLSRRPEESLSADAHSATRIAALRARGATVSCIALDVADARRTHDALRAVADADGLGGLYHCAGVLDVARADTIGPEALAEVLAPKVAGAESLSAAATALGAARFVAFSSASAVWGSVGLAHYAAGNGYLSGLCAARRDAGHHALCLALGPVAGSDMASGEEAERVLRAGAHALEPSAIFAAMDRALRSGAGELVVARADWDRYAASFAPLRADDIFADLLPVHSRPGSRPDSRFGPRPATGDGATPVTVRNPRALVESVLAAVLGLENPLPDDAPLQEAGVDSLMAVEVRDRLQSAIGRPLPATLIFDAPTPADLIAHIGNGPGRTAPSQGPNRQGNAIMDREPIAIVGIGARFPGGGEGVEAFWATMLRGETAITDLPNERWAMREYCDPSNVRSDRAYTMATGLLDGIECFDAGFFAINAREAALIDPQQRLVLETAWRALEHATIAPGTLKGSRTGVYLGVADNEYLSLLRQTELAAKDAGWLGTGNKTNVIAGRLSYHLGLVGPSLTIDTACSSSAVATHLAVEALRRGEIDCALAGGVNVILDPETFIGPCRAGMLSPGGRCRTFSDDADGYVRAEGCGILVLKRLGDALADGDTVIAAIRGSAVNQDGRSSSLTAPSGAAQDTVIRAAIADAGAHVSDIGYIETHGTGTRLGDPIEVNTLAGLFGEARPDARVALGAVKSVIGHAEAAAGVAGLIKAALALAHGTIPPNQGFRAANPEFTDADAVRFVNAPLQFDGGRLAGVSAFGFSGTNAHLVLERGPRPEEPADGDDAHADRRWPVCLSARSEAALAIMVAALKDRLADLEPGSLPALARGSCLGRDVYDHRAAFVVTSLDELREALEAWPALHESARDDHARRFRDGECIDWSALLDGRPGPRLPLPGHPFERQRFWPAAPRGPLVPARTGREGTDYLLGERLAAPRGREVRYRRRFTATQPAYVDDHRLLGTVVVPAASHVAMSLAAGRREFGTDRCAVSDIMLLSPLVIADDGAREVQLLLTPVNADGSSTVNGEAFAIELVSADVEALDGEWVTHMTATLRRGGDDHGDGVDPGAIDLADMSSWDQTIAAEEFYGHFWDHGYTLGPAFRWLAAGRRDLSGTTDRVLRRLETPELPDPDYRFPLHPGLIDTCFSVLGSGQSDWLAKFDDAAIDIPFSIESVELLRVPEPGRPLYTLAGQRHEPRGDERPPEDILVVDEDGMPVARIAGFTVKKADRAALRAAHKRTLRDLTYVREWRPEPLGMRAAERCAITILCADGETSASHAVASRLAARWERGGHQAELVREGPGNGGWIVDLRLLDCAGAIDGDADADTGRGWVPDERASEAVSRILTSAAELARAEAQPRMLLAAPAMPAAANGASAAGIEPLGDAGWAVLRALHAERPLADCRAVAMPGEAPADEWARAIEEELLRGEPMQRTLRAPDRRVETLERRRANHVSPRSWSGEEETVLVTGGTGGIGLGLVARLAAQGMRDFLLVQRSEPGEAETVRLEAIEREHGARIAVLGADLTAPDFARTLAEALGERRLCHVFHLAGAVRDRMLADFDAVEARAVLRPKLEGTAALIAIADRHDAQLTLFGSLAAVLPAPGQAAYAAANAFLEGAARQARIAGIDVRAIAWGPWSGVGMMAEMGADFERAARAMGVAPMESALGYDMLEEIGQSGDAVVVAAELDWATIAEMRPEWRGDPLLRALTPSGAAQGESAVDHEFVARVRDLPPTLALPAMIDFLRPRIASVVGLAANAPIDARSRFFEIGLDSLAATDLRQRLQVELGVALRATMAFDHPTLGELAAHLAGLLAGVDEAPERAPTAALSVGRQAVGDYAAEIDAMSEDEAMAALLQEVSAS